MEDPGGFEPLGARIKSPLPNRLGLERSGSIARMAAASRPGFLIVVVMLVSCCWFSRTVTIRGLPVIGRVLCLELRERIWCLVADSNRGSPVCRAGALATKLTKRVWCSLQDSNLGMSVCKTDALVAWQRRIWCTREDLNLHAARAAASEAAASAVSPRVRSWCRNGGSNASFRPTKAVPCHWTIAAISAWCWLEDSNLPPLAYEASALPMS